MTYIYAVILMGIFTFLFLGTEYLFDNRISLMASGEKTVLAQNYMLGISTAGFLMYPVFRHFYREPYRAVCTVTGGITAGCCILLMGHNLSYRTTLILGLFVFLFLGLSGSAVFYTSMCMMKTKKYLARTVGISYMIGILLQFVNNNLVNQEVAEAVILSVFILILAFLLVRNGQQEDGSVPFPVTDSSRNQKNSERTAAGILLILLVVLMTYIFSTLDNAVTLVHAFGTVDIGQWPRILLACSGLAAGFVFDIRNRRFMCLIMYCVMMLSTICIAIQKSGGSFLSGLFVFYLSAGFFAVFFTTGFMELSDYMRIPALWAGMGRAVNNITAALIANVSLALLSSGSSITAIVIILFLFVAVSIVTAAYVSMRKAVMEETVENTSEKQEQKDRLEEFAKLFSFTPREAEVFYYLVSTEDSIQVIADSLCISRRTMERYISSIYEKTGVKSRGGLIRTYNEK